MKKTTQKQYSAVMLAALLAASAAFINTGQAQVTFQDMTNGLVDYYPLNSVLAGSTNVTPDLISRRDMTLVGMPPGGNFVAGTNSGIGDSTNVINFTQSPHPTIMYYQSTGQNPLDGSGDFLPFINQRGATMNFWIKGAVPGSTDGRVMAECADNGDGNPFFSISDEPSSNTGLGFFLRLNATGTDPSNNTVNIMPDGTYQTPALYYDWSESSQYTTNVVFNGNWHMVTTEIDTNGDVHVYVDGIYDSGNQSTATIDNEGNPAVVPPLNVTNTYYENNIYPSAGVSNPPPDGFVHWMVPGLNAKGTFTAFGGYDRNGTVAGGPADQMSDIGFWNRALSTDEIQYLLTNGLSGLTLNPNVININSFVASFSEIGQGHTVNISWNVTGASSTPGGIVISGLGDVSATPTGSTNITLSGNQAYTFTLTAHNGIVADKEQSVSVKTFSGVPSDWNLIQRFDGVFANTTLGINGNGWVGEVGDYAGVLDRFNVVTVNGNEVLSPKSGYAPDSQESIGFDTYGSLAYGNLNDLTIPPYQENTLFFRFSLTDPGSFANSLGIYSGLDFAAGVTDFGFATGPVGGTQPPGGGGTVGPGFHITRSDPEYAASPFDLTANDYSGSSVTNSYDYLTAANGDPNGLETNVNYMVWLDVSNDNTHAVISDDVTNTVQEPVFSLWIQKQGDASRTLLFSGFHGDRDYSTAGQNSDFPTPYLNKVFVSIASEAFQNGDVGAFIETNNMLVLDDFYMSANGFDSTIPRLFNLTSIVRGANSVTINWNSLGSLFQTNTYSIQRTFSLTNPTWVTLTSGLPSGGATTTYTDTTIGSSSAAYYRVTWP